MLMRLRVSGRAIVPPTQQRRSIVGEFTVRVTLGDPLKPAAQGETDLRIADNGTFMTKLRAAGKREQ